jgi:hypothetical protein
MSQQHDPVSHVCPACGNVAFKKCRLDKMVAFTWDRVCTSCHTRYTPPTPRWAAVVFCGAGFLVLALGLAGLAGVCFLIGLAIADTTDSSTQINRLFQGVLGLCIGLVITRAGWAVIRHAFRALQHSGKA